MSVHDRSPPSRSPQPSAERLSPSAGVTDPTWHPRCLTASVDRGQAVGMRLLAVVVVVVGCSRGSSRQYQIAAGPMNACALADTGEVICWGSGGAGMLEDGKDDLFPGARVPSHVIDLVDATSISVGLSNACAVRRDQSVACWGIDWAGATRERTGSVARPQPVSGLEHVV